MSDALFYLASIDFTPMLRVFERIRESVHKILEAVRKRPFYRALLGLPPIRSNLRLRIASKTVLVLNKRGAR